MPAMPHPCTRRWYRASMLPLRCHPGVSSAPAAHPRTFPPLHQLQFKSCATTLFAAVSSAHLVREQLKPLSEMEKNSGLGVPLLGSPSAFQDDSGGPATHNSSKSRGSPVVRRDSSYQHVAARQSLGNNDSPGPAVPVDESRFQLGWERAASTYFEDSALEQKMWIQCTLDGAKKRGDDWIDSAFTDDVVSGCSACLPDIVVVNDKSITKNTEAFKARVSAPWQRVRPSPFCILFSRLSLTCIETV
jgi:hypothetical protein